MDTTALIKRRSVCRRRLWVSTFVLAGLYLPVMAEPVFQSISLNGGHVTLSWSSTPGNVYEVQSRADVQLGVWNTQTSIVAGALFTSWTDSWPLLGNRFYRLHLPNGDATLFEPPEMAFGEPNSQASALGHELAHASQQRRGFNQGETVQLFSGEFVCSAVDLHIKGRGLDFIWARRYRSRAGPETEQGHGWDFSYHIYLERLAQHVVVHDGNTRRDVFLRQPDGSYAADQFFREGRFDSNGVFTLTFSDRGRWEFHPLDRSARHGKINRSIDRNGNALTFSYDGAGRLNRITDTLGRDITVEYNREGFIESVRDFIGRQVTYDYYQNGDAGGSRGDLKSVTSPIVTNTPNGNDFPAGKMTTYTYSKTFAHESLNHNLLTITDAKGQTWLQNRYASTTNPENITFDRIETQVVGGSNEVRAFYYSSQTPALSNGSAVVKAILNDPVGNVSEHFYDAGNRLVLLREYTGRATPGQATTESLNRPVNPLRTNDPPFFETRFEWSVDSMLTRMVFPKGNSVSNTYELALNPAAARRSRGNLRARERFPGLPGGDQVSIVERFEYDAGAGDCCDFNFVTRHTDGRSNDTFFAYDERGNRTNIIHRLPSIREDFEYNPFGQLTAYVAPGDGSGHRARFEGRYYTSGVQHSYLHQAIVDAAAGGLNLTTTYENDAVGNVVRMVDPRGNDSHFTYNSLNQLVRSQSPVLAIVGGASVRYTNDYSYDANNNLVLVNRSNHDEAGRLYVGNLSWETSYEYDVLNRLVLAAEEENPTNKLVTEFQYDGNRNLTLVRTPEAVNGRQTGNVVRLVYDERDLLFRRTRAPGLPDESIDELDYDGNANCTKVSKVDSLVIKQSTMRHDGFNRPVALTDAMGNVTSWHYDPNGNTERWRVDGEMDDTTDGASNTLMIGESYRVYDAMDRLIRTDTPHFHPATQTPIGDGQSTTRFSYSPASQLLTVVDDNSHTTRYSYDSAHRLLRVTDPKTNTVTYAYDANGSVITETQVDRSDLGSADQKFITQFQYDALGRLVREVDNMTNTVHYGYDSRDNPVLVTDALGLQTRRIYDGQGRQITVIRDMNTNGPSLGDATDIVLHQEWDGNSRLVAQTDDNTNTTRYAYDSLNRLIRAIHADGTSNRLAYDVHDNRIVLSNANGTVVTSSYDLLNRLRTNSIAPGPDVSADTTFEFYRYDGLSRLILAQDDDATNTLSWDSMGNLVRETVNGMTSGSSHDGEGNRLTQSYPGGRMLEFVYDANNNATEYQEGGVTAFTRKIIGPRRTELRSFANRTSTDVFYDGVSGMPNAPGDFGVGQVARVRHQLTAAFDERAFGWDRNQNRSLGTRVIPGGLMHQYSYDAANRLARTRVMHPTTGIVRDTGYELDGVGNRVSVTDEGSSQTYKRDATLPEPADFQVNQYTATPVDAREYDANGNLIAINPGERTERQLLFDYRDQLVRHAAPGGTTTSYTYDALGRRMARVIRPGLGFATTNRYFWSSSIQRPSASQWFTTYGWRDHVIEEQNGAGVTLATYIHGEEPSGPIQMQRGTNTFFYHGDDLGNVFALTDERGIVVERYDYGDFGEPEFFDGAGGAIPQSAVGNPYLFQGLRYDAETGYYSELTTGTSYLDPLAGRWLNRNGPDKLGNAVTFSGNNPGRPQARFTMFKADGTPIRSRRSTSNYAFTFPTAATTPDLGSWSKATGLDVVWDTLDYQPLPREPEAGKGFGLLHPSSVARIRYRTFSLIDRTQFSRAGPTAGGPSKDWVFGTELPTLAAYRANDRLRAAGPVGAGHSVNDHPDFAWLPIQTRAGWTGWSDFYRSFAVEPVPASPTETSRGEFRDGAGDLYLSPGTSQSSSQATGKRQHMPVRLRMPYN